MFERRLKRLLALFGALLGAMVWRLVDLQLVHAADYRDQARGMLLYPARELPFVRGRILDRLGAVLAADEPSWQVAVDYDVLSGEAAEAGRYPVGLIDTLWVELAAAGGVTLDEIERRREAIVRRVQRWQRAVSEHRGYDITIREQRMAHAVLEGLDDQAQIAARQRFRRFAFVEVENAARRTGDDHPAWGHVLGRLGPVTAEELRNDPHADDPLASLQATDRVGIAGVEYLAESRLRGRRGRQRYDRSGGLVENAPAEPGEDVRLTLRSDLQTRLYDLLEALIPEVSRISTGGAVVVLHVPTREVLALVSYPGYDVNRFNEVYDELRDDTKGTPLRFRAVANCYEPGSIVKPLTCLAGLESDAITFDSTFECTGYYNPAQRDRYRCWAISGTNRRKRHGHVNVTEAIAGSCNVFMYHTADLVGVGGLTRFFDMAGLGRASGTGLREERSGINPTPSWLMTHRNALATLGRARNYAIGQGELIVTPVQAANIMALYASGKSQCVTLLRDEEEAIVWNLPIDDSEWRAVREGLFRVTNDVYGTAYHTAHWSNGRWALCGKTGSATTRPAPTHYRVAYTDENGGPRVAIIPAKLKQHAVDEFRRRYPQATFDPAVDVSVELVWPPRKPDDADERHSHAWFAGYLQRVDASGAADLSAEPRIAFSVLVEYGGSGGYVAGPIAKQTAQVICDTLGEALNPDAEPRGPAT